MDGSGKESSRRVKKEIDSVVVEEELEEKQGKKGRDSSKVTSRDTLIRQATWS